MKISKDLISWYLKNKRDLPWRDTTDPYKIWLSEIILQQTRVNQGMDYYLRFVNTYPDVKSLALARLDEVLKLWQGLGYYSRARNLHQTAKHIHFNLDGKFPDTYKELLSLKGIGPYTAAAIGSFAFGLKTAVVDGNVGRVISRIFDIEEPINEEKGKKRIQQISDELIPEKDPDLFNQAVMELGALICTPSSPKCTECPVSEQCMALERKTIAIRPVKTKKTKQRLRHIHYAVLETSENLIFRKRKEKDIWEGLHDFASLEGDPHPSEAEVSGMVAENFPQMQIQEKPLGPEQSYTHILSHQKLEAKFWRFKVHGEVHNNSIYLSVPKNEVDTLAIPRLIQKYLEDIEML